MTKEPGRLAYEAWCHSHGRDPAWRLIHLLDQMAWAAAEQAASERAWDEGYDAGRTDEGRGVAFDECAVNPYRQPPKGDDDGR